MALHHKSLGVEQSPGRNITVQSILHALEEGSKRLKTVVLVISVQCKQLDVYKRQVKDTVLSCSTACLTKNLVTESFVNTEISSLENE